MQAGAGGELLPNVNLSRCPKVVDIKGGIIQVNIHKEKQFLNTVSVFIFCFVCTIFFVFMLVSLILVSIIEQSSLTGTNL